MYPPSGAPEGSGDSWQLVTVMHDVGDDLTLNEYCL